MTNTVNWENVYEAILLDIVEIVNDRNADWSKIEKIKSLLKSNDFEI